MSAYRILVTGSRTWDDPTAVHDALINAYLGTRATAPVTVVHGACPQGADTITHDWITDMRASGWVVTEERHPAQGHPAEDFGPWPGAGPRRNAYMVGLGAAVCLAFIGPCSKPRCREQKPHDSHGTAGTVLLCEAAGIPVKPFRSAS